MKLKRMLALFLAVSCVITSFPAMEVLGKDYVTTLENIAEGCSYTVTVPPSGSYKDSGGELTDGKNASMNYYDANWVGFGGDTKIIIDLGSVQEFRGIKVHNLCSADGGIRGTNSVKVEYSNDAQNWETLIEELADPKHGEWHNEIESYECAAETPVEAQYVRLSPYKTGSWLFISEVEVLADVPLKPAVPVIEESEYYESLFYVREGEDYTLEVKGTTQDPGEISYQWYENEQPVGTNSPTYTIENVSLSKSGSAYWCVVTNTLNDMTATKQSKMSMMSVVKASVNADFPVFNTDLPTEIEFSKTEGIKLSVAASVTDGGTLSYQWYRDGAKIGTNSNTLTLNNIDLSYTGTYKVVATNKKNNLIRRTTSTECQVTVVPDFGENLVKGIAYDTNISEDGMLPGYADADRTKLTDEVKTTTVSDAENVGFGIKDGGAQVTFVMDGAKNISEIHINAYNDADNGINTPANVEVSGFVDNNWVTIFEGGMTSDADKKQLVITADTPVKASALRFMFSDYGDWLVLDDFAVYAEKSGLVADGYIAVQEGANNLVAGKPYEKTAKPESSYTDIDDKEITDGIYASANYVHSGWVAYQTEKEPAFIFDLGYGATFEEVAVTSLNDIAPGIRFPSHFIVEVSDDKENWEKVLTRYFTVSTKQETIKRSGILAEPVTCRYVKVTVVRGGGWNFISEIEIFKTASDSAVTNNNLALGTSYTATNVSSERPDGENALKLTDGHSFATDAKSATWVGFEGDAEVVIDLKGVKDFEQITARFSEDGYALPDSVKVSVSNDKSAWTPVAEAFVTSNEFNMDASANGFRYVKLNIASDEAFLLDEICVLEVKEIFDEQIPDEFYKDKNNLALEKDYVVSWDASETYPDSSKELTDGARGTHLYSDKKWAGYPLNNGEKFSVTVDLGAVESFEQVQVGILESSSPSLLIKYPKELVIEYSVDGVNWDVYVDEMFVYYEGTGIKRQNYLGSAEAQYVRFTFTQNSILFLDEIAVYKTEVPGLDYELDPDSGASLNMARGKDYTVSRDADYRDIAGLLTDGIYGNTGTVYDKNWTGFKGEEGAEVVIDLGEFCSVQEVIISSLNSDAASVTTPKNAKVWASNSGKEWAEVGSFAENTDTGAVEVIWNGERDGVMGSNDYDMIYTRYIKVSFDVPENKTDYAYLDEIKVIAKRGKTSTSVQAVFKNVEYNLALNREYTFSPVHVNNQFDVDNKQLTDGVLGALDGNDTAWVRCNENQSYTTDAGDKAVIQSFVVPLVDDEDDYKYVTKVETHFFAEGGYGSGSDFPWNIWTYASNDGINWFMLQDKHWDVSSRVWWGGNLNSGWRTAGRDLIDPSVTAIKAKYIRLDFELCYGALIDEVIVYGYDDEVEGFMEIPEEKCRKLGDPAIIREKDDALYHAQDYQKAGESTRGVQDMLLCYNGYQYNAAQDRDLQAWTEDMYYPHLVYVNEDGEAVDYMFDSVLFLAIIAKSKRRFTYGADKGYEATFEDYEWYMNKLFKEGGDMDELNKTAKRISEEFNDPDYKVKVTVMHPGIDTSVPTKFGPIDGVYYNLSEEADWKFVCDWWINAVMDGMFYEDGTCKYEFLDFSGFYWMDEQVGFTTKYITHVADRTHKLGYNFYWIPMTQANGVLWARDVGFDAIAYQPNHFFGEGTNNDSSNISAVGNSWIDHIAYMCNYYNIGVEMEIDSRFVQDMDIGKYNQWIDYLNGVKRNGLDGKNSWRAWYTSLYAMIDAAHSDIPEIRKIYDYSYQIMKGTYEIQPHITEYSKPGNDNVLVDTITGQGGGGSGGAYYKPEEDTVVAPETAVTSDEGYTWMTGNNGYRLKNSNDEYVTGWAEVDGEWYYLNADGYMATGWVKDGNTWYYLRNNGTMVSNGWYAVDGVWYYFGSTGAMKLGWVLDNSRWYYMTSSGAMAKTCWKQIDGKWYYFTGSGAMATGWVAVNNNWYYLDESGAMVTGWKLIKGSWYYLVPANGAMAKDTTVDGYKLGSDGAMI